MAGILFDTSVYISALIQGDEAILSLRRAARAQDQKAHPLWLSAVVLHELYVGAESARARKELQRLERENSSELTGCSFLLASIGRPPDSRCRRSAASTASNWWAARE